jgi:hypothetical protein
VRPRARLEIRSMAELQQQGESFVPRGAIAFFAVMVVAYAAFWLAFYAIAVGRGS